MHRYISIILIGISSLLIPVSVFATASSVNRITNHIEPLITSDYIKGVYFIASSTTSHSTFPYASTTALSAGTICLTSDTCRTTWPTASGGAFPFSADTNYGTTVYSTSTPTLWFKSGLYASSTSIFVNASTTNLTTTSQWFTGLTSGELAVDANGKVYKGATSTLSTISGSLDLNAQVGVSRLPFANLTQISANSVLGNNTGAAADGGSVSTSSLYVGTNGQVLARVGGAWIGVATTTLTNGGPITAAYNGTTWTLGCSTCNTSSATVTSITGGLGLNGGSITTSGTLSLISYIATSSSETKGQLAVFGSTSGTPALIYSQATSTITPSSPLTGSFTSIGSGSVGCQTASGSQAGCLAAVDFSKFNSATTTFSLPLVYTQGTNAVTCPTCSTLVYTDPFTHPAAGQSATSSLMLLNGNASTTQESSTMAYFGGTATSTFTAGGFLGMASSSPWGLLSINPNALAAGVPSFVIGSSTQTNFVVTQTGRVGLGTTTPWALLTLTANASSSGTTLFAIASTSNFAGVFSTTTLFQVSNKGVASTSNLIDSGVVSALHLAGADGTVSAYAGASACSANNFVTTISAVGGSTCGTAAISGVNLGSNLNSFTVGTDFTGTGYNGSAAVSDWAIKMSQTHTWTALQQFNGNASTTQLSATTGYFGGTATSTFTAAGFLGIASSTPWGLLSINPNALPAGAPAFVIGSSTPQGTGTLFSINQFGGIQQAATTSASSTTITLDWTKTPQQVEYQVGTAATTLNIVNATTSTYYGSRKLVWVCNPPLLAAGALTINNVEWIGTKPTQTTTAAQCDAYSFDITAASSSQASPTYKVAGTGGTGFQ